VLASAGDARVGSAVVVCEAGGGTHLERRPAPEPGPGELVLALRGCGLCGTDLFKLDHGVAAGTVLGHELVGSVVAIGPGVDAAFAIGRRVVVPHHVACGACDLCRAGNETLCAEFRRDLLAPGGFAEHVLVRARAVEVAARLVPDTLSDETAVFLEPASCVLRGIARSGLPDYAGDGRGRTVAVLGGGSMGLLHLLVLRALFPELDVLVSDPLAARRRLAERLGGRGVAPPELAEATAESGLDAVFDTVGGAAALDQALALTREGGTVVLFAHARPGERPGFDLNRFFKSERRLVATYSGSLAEQQVVWGLLVGGRLDPAPLITHRLPLSEFSTAVALTRRHQALKVLLVPDRAAPRGAAG
jgi:L-iditol 2-dehydrogenase